MIRASLNMLLILAVPFRGEGSIAKERQGERIIMSRDDSLNLEILASDESAETWIERLVSNSRMGNTSPSTSYSYSDAGYSLIEE